MTPILTCLSYSAGVQSQCLLEMILRGELKRPESFLVLNADPGMEDERSYAFTKNAAYRCLKAGIEFITATGPNLFHDLTTFKERGLTRIDNPPLWTRNRVTGKKGQLSQGCTQAYKIQPMRRALRNYLKTKFNISLSTKRLPTVEMWIGFSADEASRIKPSDVKYVQLAYPLITLGMSKADCEKYYTQHGIERPPRSVCNACFANGLAYLEDMYMNRPFDWDKAVVVDDAIRDMRSLGIEDECFVSSSLKPLRELPDLDFLRHQPTHKELRCNSKHCFV